jgi:cytochrome c oxidase subunit 3
MSTISPMAQASITSQPRITGNSEATRTGIWVAVFAITMSFAALTSALYVRQGSSDWSHVVIPRVIYLNTVALLLSSSSMEMARRTKARVLALTSNEAAARLAWLAATLALGMAFVAGQCLAWRQLAVQGLFLATNPNSSFLYVLTGAHAMHVLAGIAALVFLIGKLAGSPIAFRKHLLDNTAVYWHFMTLLWLYLLFVIRTRL